MKLNLDKILADTTYVFIFDLDDTLYKEFDYVHSAFSHIDRMLVADYGYSEGKAREIMLRALIDNANPFDQLNAQLVADGIKVPDAINWMVDEYRYHIPHLYLPDDSYQLLDTLYSNGVEMYIITDGRSVTQRNKIRALGIDEFIPDENVLISEEVGEEKTSCTALKRIIERYDHDEWFGGHMRFVFIGDNPAKDFLIGNQWGYTTIMLLDDGSNIHDQRVSYLPKRYRPQFKVAALTDVLDLWARGAF